MTKNTGGSAFPVQSIYIEDQETNSHGMTLRDYFAAKAMQTYMISETWNSDTYKSAAKSAYIVADEMLKARKA